MKWIGAHIWDLVSRFRRDVHLEKDVYLEDVENQGSGNLASKHLTVDNSTGKVSFRTGAELKADIGALELGTTSLTALAGSTVTISFAQTQAITANTNSATTLNTVMGAVITAMALNTAKETDKHYVHTQSVSSATWVVTHSLGKHPSVSVTDSAGTAVVGKVDYDSLNQVTLNFKSTFSGKAYFN
tara:strand:- start:9 stop:566 length:558 start_codon:yes stop_codon:yes gene_type:complete